MSSKHHKRWLAGALALALAAAQPAAAQDSVPTGAELQDAIVAQLQSQGFNRITIGRTFLGRVRITATSDRLEREIIFNPRTGEILRDYWDEPGADERGGTLVWPEDRSSDDGPAVAPGSDDPSSDRSPPDDSSSDDRSDARPGAAPDDEPDRAEPAEDRRSGGREADDDHGDRGDDRADDGGERDSGDDD